MATQELFTVASFVKGQVFGDPDTGDVQRVVFKSGKKTIATLVTEDGLSDLAGIQVCVEQLVRKVGRFRREVKEKRK